MILRFAAPADEIAAFLAEHPGMALLQHGPSLMAHADDQEKAEYFVRVQWLDSVPKAKAFKELGLFGNQNTVCQPRTPKWRHTVERLKTHFKDWDKQR